MRTIIFIGLLGFALLVTMPPTLADTNAETLQRIIDDLIAHPPETSGDSVVGEQMC